VPGITDCVRGRVVRERLGGEPVFTGEANGPFRRGEEAVDALEAVFALGVAPGSLPCRREYQPAVSLLRRILCALRRLDPSQFLPAG